jgi:nifR3 family TIM-barrel protein
MADLRPIDLCGAILAPPVALAPLAGITDLPFRQLVASFGAGWVVSEMVASQEMVQAKPGVREKAELGLGDGLTAVQLAGREPSWMAEAARMVEANGARIIDINMGCPAKKVTNGWSGSALLREPDHALRLIEAVVGAVSVPVTLKTRLGWDDSCHNAPYIATRAEEAGVRMVTIHGRTDASSTRDAPTGPRSAPQGAVTIPVIANGDILDLPPRGRRCAFGRRRHHDGAARRGAHGLPPQVARLTAAAGLVPDRCSFCDMVSGALQAMLAFYGPAWARVAASTRWYMDRAGTPRPPRARPTSPDPRRCGRLPMPATAREGARGMIGDDALWTSLPIPALLLGPDDTILGANPAAELFLNLSAKALRGAPVFDKVMIDAPLEEAFRRARAQRSSLFVNDVDVGSGERPPLQCNIHFAPLQRSDGQMLMLISPREMATRMTQNAGSQKAAKSAIGWPRCWRTRSRTRWPASPEPRSSSPAGSRARTSSSPT